MLMDLKGLLVKKAIVDEKDPLVFKVLLEIKVSMHGEESMGSEVSEEKRAYKVILEMF